MFTRRLELLAACFVMMGATGCSRAPSINVIGSFLPSWMLCLAFGVLFSGLTRWKLMTRKLEHYVMPIVVFYPSLAVAMACLVWLLFFR
jgi:YtcA-like protein